MSESEPNVKYYIHTDMNTLYTVIFKSARDRQAVRTVAMQAYPTQHRYFLDAYLQATSKSFGNIHNSEKRQYEVSCFFIGIFLFHRVLVV